MLDFIGIIRALISRDYKTTLYYLELKTKRGCYSVHT